MKKTNAVKKAIKQAKKEGLFVQRSACKKTWGVFFGKNRLEVVHSKRAAEATLTRLNKKFPMLGVI
jgi:hypothetical protein